MEKLNIGIVGSKFIASLHALTYSNINSSRFALHGCVSGSYENGKAFATKWNIPRVYKDYDEMLRDPEIHAIDLCTPNDLHRDMIVAAAEAGKHIICEKPLSGAFGEAKNCDKPGLMNKRELLAEALDNTKKCVDAVKKAGVGFGYAENFVYAPPVHKAKRLIAESKGTILDIRAEESHSGSHAAYAKEWRKAGGGSLIRLGAHPIGAALHLKSWEGLKKFGKPIRPASIVADVGNLTKMASFEKENEKWLKTGWVDVEDWSCAIITFDDGSRATIHSSDCVLGGVRNQMTIYASNAVFNINMNPNDTLKIYAPRAGIFGDEYIQEKLETNGGWNFPAPDEEWIRGYNGELTDFIDAFLTKREPESGLTLAEDTMKVIYAGYVSAEEGRRINITNC
jgi:predicted dehydrogenase